jgi:hypothetical protein
MDEITIALELWNSLKNYVPAKERQSAADHYFTTITDLGIDVDSHRDEIHESCDYLFKSLTEYLEELEGDSEYDEDYDE